MYTVFGAIVIAGGALYFLITIAQWSIYLLSVITKCCSRRVAIWLAPRPAVPTGLTLEELCAWVEENPVRSVWGA
jgi:hypothetical protein